MADAGSSVPTSAVFEGETLACGTGTVAAGVALAARERWRSRSDSGAGGVRQLQVRAGLDGRQVSDVWLGGQGKFGVPGGLGGLTAGWVLRCKSIS